MSHVIVEEDHATHWTINPVTGERVGEMSVVVDGVRTFWCGHREPA
jgi:hypothetical protein